MVKLGQKGSLARTWRPQPSRTAVERHATFRNEHPSKLAVLVSQGVLRSAKACCLRSSSPGIECRGLLLPLADRRLSNLSFAPRTGFVKMIATVLSASGESIDACG